MQTHNESSVLFNLQELMRIEHDRVEAEHAAARALEEQARQREREKTAARLRAREEQRAAMIAQERAEAEHAARLETARAVALEQTRLAMELAERAERQRLEHQHAETLAAMVSAPRLTLRQGLVAATVVSMIVALGYFGVVAPMLHQGRTMEAQARALADHYAREIQALRQTPVVSQTGASSLHEVDAEPTSATSVTEPTATAATLKTKRTGNGSRTKATNASNRTAHRAGNEQALGSLDSDDDDPIRGL